MPHATDEAIRLIPAPSRWSYRLQRLMLTPLFRTVLRVGLPFGLTVCFRHGISGWNEQRQEKIMLAVADIPSSNRNPA